MLLNLVKRQLLHQQLQEIKRLTLLLIQLAVMILLSLELYHQPKTQKV